MRLFFPAWFASCFNATTRCSRPGDSIIQLVLFSQMFQNSLECHHSQFGPFHHDTAALLTNSDRGLREFHLPGPWGSPHECHISPLSVKLPMERALPQVFAERGQTCGVVPPQWHPTPAMLSIISPVNTVPLFRFQSGLALL